MSTAEHVALLAVILVIAVVLHLDYRRLHHKLNEIEARRGARHAEIVAAMQGRRRSAAKPGQLVGERVVSDDGVSLGLDPWV